MIDNIIKNTLTPVCKNISKFIYTGKAAPYITYLLVTQTDTNPSDDTPTTTNYTYRIDVFAKENYNQLLENIKTALQNAGFYNITFGPELYETETQLYHMPIDVDYSIFKGDEQ